jgi:HEAT repeat protein
VAAPGARLPSGFVTAAVAMLKLDPGLCAGLVEIFERPTTSLAARALLLDILASTGHPAAQQAMRDALSSDAARRDPAAFGTLLQRLSLIPSPDGETLTFAAATYHEAKGEVRNAASYALGTALGERARGGDPQVQREADALRGDLRAARAPADKVALLGALGNAGFAADVALVKSFAHDADAHVRRQAALSLRKPDTVEATDALLEMMGDAESSVGVAAMQSLGERPLSPHALDRLAAMVGTPAVPGILDEWVISLVADTPADHDKMAAVLRAVVASSHDPHTLARARMVLGQLDPT